MTVLSIAYPFAPVGPHAVGGSEQILSHLDRELVAAGHTSLVVACDGSEAQGVLFANPVPKDSELTEANQRIFRGRFQAVIDQVLRSHAVDLIHMHGLDSWEYTIRSNVPVLVTLHLPITWYPNDIARRRPGNMHLQCVSETQRATCPPELRAVPVIANGVEIPPFPQTTKSDFVIAMGRICPEKNLHAALEAGTLARTTVLLAGQVFPYPAHQQYFCEKVVPLLGRHQFVGPLVPPRKQELLAQAKCLLHPTLAPETSSLVAMEAMAAGTPVIAFRSGALTEIVEDGITGFLVNSVEEMAEAIRNVDSISPRACWEAANSRFSKQRMLQQYFRLYRTLMAGHQREQRCA